MQEKKIHNIVYGSAWRNCYWFARMLLNTEHERVSEDGIIYRRGIKVERLTEKMTEIGENIRKKKEDESYGFKPSH